MYIECLRHTYQEPRTKTLFTSATRIKNVEMTLLLEDMLLSVKGVAAAIVVVELTLVVIRRPRSLSNCDEQK